MNRRDYVRLAIEWADKAADISVNGIRTGDTGWIPEADYSKNSALVAAGLAQAYAALAAIPDADEDRA